MRRAFFPAVALMNSMGYTKKFMVLWLISLAAIAVVTYSLFVSLNRVILTSQRQLDGIELIKPVFHAAQFSQQHRGVSAALLGGNDAMRDELAAKEAEIDGAFKAMEERLPPGLASYDDFRRIKADWVLLRNEGTHWAIVENFDAHSRLIEQIRLFAVDVADEYALTTKSEIDTFYLIDTIINKLPDALEHFGQIRGYGASILARKQITEQQKNKLNSLIVELHSALDELNINLRKTSRHNPALQGAILAIANDITGSAQQIASLVASDVITGRFATPHNVFLGMTTAAIDKSYTQLHDLLLPMAGALIKARIAQAENTLRMSVGIAILLFLAAIYCSAGIYYTIIGSIQSLAHSAHTFAGGDLKQRVRLNTRDELSQIGDSFNRMADGFNVLLEARREDEARLRATIETTMDAVVQMDDAGIIIGWNSQAEKIFGWSSEEATGRMLHQTIIPPQYREAHVNGLKHFLATGEGPALNSRIETVGLHRDGHEFPVELAIAPILAGGKHEFSAFIRDITKKKESEELIWKQANFDTLTGLPNRHMFYDRLEQDIKKAHRADMKMALLFIDLDKFKEINDTLGHGMGDILLVEAARRISDCVRETDTVARLGGDEFTIIMAELDDTSNIGRITGSILRKLAEPFRLGDKIAYVSASIGITLYPDDATEIRDLLKNADQAMYTAKNKGRNCFSYFTQSMQQTAQTRLLLINELRGALAADQFRIYYQPIVDLATGRINKAEALVRWQHPERGMVSPAQFIPLAEETGLIVEIGDWVFRESARQLAYWRALCSPELQISVNVSPMQLCDADVCLNKTCFAYLHELGLPGQSIVIEITEGLLLDSESGVAGKLLEFHNASIQISIDDFGTGYSSLSYLQKFDIDYLKIDQSFVRNLAENSNNMALSEAIIVMAHKLGLKVIAEGVETQTQCKLLAAAGCDYGQGYLFSKPLPPGEFETLLSQNRKPSPAGNAHVAPFLETQLQIC